LYYIENDYIKIVLKEVGYMDILAKLEKLMEDNKWTYYRLAQESGLSQPTITNIFKRNAIPHIDTLEKICDAFGLTLSQFFIEDNEKFVPLTNTQRDLFRHWETLPKEKKRIIEEMIELTYKSDK